MRWPAAVLRWAERLVRARDGCGFDLAWRCFGASTVTGGRSEDCAEASVTRSTESAR